ncbi:zinc finger protein 8-like, partial [Agrilus planipennis]
MDNAHYIFKDVDFTATKDNNLPSSDVNIKEEAIVDEDILLLTSAEMEEFSRDSSNFRMVEDIVDGDALMENSSFNIQQLNDPQMNQTLTGENFTKLPIDVGSFYKMDQMKTDRNMTHFVKYKIQDGRHSKVYECGICSKEFGHQYTLMRHLPTHTDERKFQCNTCGK